MSPERGLQRHPPQAEKLLRICGFFLRLVRLTSQEAPVQQILPHGLQATQTASFGLSALMAYVMLIDRKRK